MDIRCP